MDNCQEFFIFVYIQVDDVFLIDFIEDQISCGIDFVSFILNNNFGELGVSYFWISMGLFILMEFDFEVMVIEIIIYYFIVSLNDCIVIDLVIISLILLVMLEVGFDQIV